MVRVVLVDDEPEVRELLRTRLARHGGFEVVGEGGDGPDAIDLCIQHEPDVVILDALMPSGLGTQFVPEVFAASPSTLVIIFTADTGMATRDAAEAVGAHAVIGKLDPFDRLVGTIFRLLPEKAPALEHDDFGDRMAELLTAEEVATTSSWWRSRGGTRKGLVVVLVLVVLPLAAATVWATANLVGGLG